MEHHKLEQAPLSAYRKEQAVSGLEDMELEARLKKMMEEKQKIVAQYEPMVIIPPALFSPEQLEQIRMVIREELERVLASSTVDTSANDTEMPSQ